MTELHDLTALEQASAIRREEISPVELTEHYLARVERYNADVGAYVTVTSQRARSEARTAERLVQEAARSGDVGTLPPLLGVPLPIKDLNVVEGVRCMFGSAAFRDFVAPLDDNVVTLLRRAGTVLLGKTNTPEFGLPCYTESAVAPPARTPWDLSRSAGGSSGGAAAAVAAGLAPLAQGSDGGGSIRTPASVCGLVGLKPSRGRVSNGPLMGDVGALAVQGPITRTVRDAAALLDIVSVPMPGDLFLAPPLPEGDTFLDSTERDPGRLRIGRFATPVIARAEVHAECVAAYEAASALLAGLGHDVEDVPAPFGPDSVPAFETVWSSLAAAAPIEAEREPLLLPLTRWLRERGRSFTAATYLGAATGLQMLMRTALTAWQPYDAILTPTLAQPPVPVGALRNDDDPAADFEAQKAFTPFTAVFNVTGQPAITLPLHQTPGGLPVGVMLAGRVGGEALLLALAAQLEAVHPWRDRHPACW